MMALRTARTLAAACVIAGALAPTLRAQAILGVTGGAVRYDSSTAGSLALNPELRYERRGLVLDAGGGYTSGSDGGRIVDGGGTVWAATQPFAGHFQLDGLAQGSFTSPHADSSSSSLLGLGELAYAAEGRGFATGIGAQQGTIQGVPTATALRTEVRGWYDFDVVTAAAAVEPTRLEGSWFVDYAGSVEHSAGPVDMSAALRLREVSGGGLTLGGAGSVSWDATPNLAAELDVGRYLRDPYQGLPSGYFVSLAIRYKLAKWHAAGGEGVGQASLGDVQLTAARAFGFAGRGLRMRRSVSQLPAAARGSNGRGIGSSSSGTGTGTGRSNPHRP